MRRRHWYPHKVELLTMYAVWPCTITSPFCRRVFCKASFFFLLLPRPFRSEFGEMARGAWNVTNGERGGIFGRSRCPSSVLPREISRQMGTDIEEGIFHTTCNMNMFKLLQWKPFIKSILAIKSTCQSSVMALKSTICSAIKLIHCNSYCS